MVPSSDPIVIVIHLLALVLFATAAFRFRQIEGKGYRHTWHYGWVGMTLLTIALVLMDFEVVR